MKIKFLIGIILVIGIVFQFFRINELNQIVDVVSIRNSKEVHYTSTKEIPKNEDKYLVLISHVNDGDQKLILKNIDEVFGYAKINYDTKILKDLKPDEIYRYRGIIVATENYRLLHKDVYEEIKRYVEKGNSLIILITSYFNPFNKFVGIKNLLEFQVSDGLVFEKSIFPGFIDVPLIGDYANSISNTVLDVTLEDDVKIIAKTATGLPLIFQRDIGKGRVIYNNSTFFSDKSVNAFLLQIISYGSDYFIQNIVNTKVIDIDDFPAPLPSGKDKIIYTDYKIDTRDFFKNIWWKDIKKLGKDKKLIYTGLIIGTYEDITDPNDFTSNEQNSVQDKIYFGRELLALGGDIGIHGYNHQPLGLTSELNHNYNYHDWKNIEDMKKALNIIRNDFIGYYGGLEPKVYVPPSNMLGKTGKKALKEAIPSLEVLAGVYESGGEKGVLVTGIGWDKDEPTLYDFPRFSSGLPYSDVEMLEVYKGIALYGIVHHFFHPDDILDDERSNGKNWETLKKEFSMYLDNINEKFGFLRAQTAYNGAIEAMKLEKLKTYSFRKGDTINIYYENFPEKVYQYFRIRNKKVDKVIGGKINFLSYDGETNLYLLESNKEEITIKLK